MDFELSNRSFSFNSLDYDVSKIATFCGCKVTQVKPEAQVYNLRVNEKKPGIDLFLLDIMFPYSIPQEHLDPTFDTFNTTHRCAYAKFPSTKHVMVSIPWLNDQGLVIEVVREDYQDLIAEIRRSWEAVEFAKEDEPELSDDGISLFLTKYPSQIVELMVRYYCGSAPCTYRGLLRLDGAKTYSLEELTRLGAGPCELFMNGVSVPIVEEIEDEVFIFYEDNFKEYQEEVARELKGKNHVATAVGEL